jgi:hypothetical protein
MPGRVGLKDGAMPECPDDITLGMGMRGDAD